MRPRSRNALAPALTVITGWVARASRSAEMSPVTSAPRWTPPMPPVAKTLTPAAAARATDALTVVAPNVPPLGDGHGQVALCGLACASPRIRSCSVGVEPDPGHAVEHRGDRRDGAGARIAATQRSSASAFAGEGSPRLEKIVDSRATTAASGVECGSHLRGDDRRQHRLILRPWRTATRLRCAWSGGTCR